MQNVNSEFDLQLKAMMEAAEVPAPAGAWDAIAARLDAAAAPVAEAGAGAGLLFGVARSRRVWGWAAASLAMAASLALGIFLFTRGESNSGDEVLVAESVELTAPEVTATEPTEAAGLPITVGNDGEKAAGNDGVKAAGGVNANLLADNTLSKSSSVKSGRRFSVTGSESSSSQTRSAEEQAAVEQKAEPAAEAEGLPITVGNNEKAADAGTSTGSVTGSAAGSAAGSTAAVNDEPKADPFAQMAMEDALKAKKSRRSYSAYVDGSFTTNNAGARPGAYGVSAADEYTQTGVTETSKSSYGLPLSVGAGVRFHLNDRLSIGTGVDYSLLTRTFKGDYVSASEQVSGDIRHTMQYLGVPVDIFVKLLDFQGFHLYSFVGAEAEYGITNKFTILESAKNTVVGDKCHGMQYSAAFGLGIEFKLSDRIGLYVDPSARYYFDCRQPKSIRTEKPFLLMFDAGLRFNL